MFIEQCRYPMPLDFLRSIDWRTFGLEETGVMTLSRWFLVLLSDCSISE